MSITTPEQPQPQPAPAEKPARQPYVRAVGPRLRILLYAIFVLVALLGANAGYLSTITFIEWYSFRWGDKLTFQNYFYQCMFLLHLALGLLLIVPLVVFGTAHLITSRNRKNKRAIRVGYLLFATSLVVLVTGIALMRVGGFDLKQPVARSVTYWLHFAAPLVAGWLYWLHRLVGPKIKWKLGISYAAVTAVLVAAMVGMHSLDPRKWNQQGPASGVQYFEPSLVRTVTGNFIPADVLQMDSYCLKCHEDAYKGWFHSSHHFSSFNNAAYLASVRETRKVAFERDGSVQASRWCAGCHDPVPFFSGAFDDPKFDDVNHPTSQAGITCTTCHAITHVNSSKGNADFTIDEPVHYPFAQSKNAFLQFVNQQLVKAKPEFHKKTFLKDFHKSAEFCSTCHKVHLPMALNKYKEFLRGQNHYDTYLLSGVSGHGTRSFYYPEKAETNCAGCHMPLQTSGDFGAKFFDSKDLKIHNHLFPAANTGIAWLKDQPQIIAAHQEFLKGKMRVDIFGLKEGGVIDGKLHAPLRPTVPTLKPGGAYLLETVIRTLKMGHPFTQGTADSNEVWLEVTLSSGGKVIGKSGGMDAQKEVDPWSHFINIFMLDRNGKRIDRRNPQDIFVPLYNHQIPPGAGQTAHYKFDLPKDLKGPVTIEVKLQYRKFDKIYTDYIVNSARKGDNPIRNYTPGKPYLNEFPVTTLAVDTVTLPVDGVAVAVENPKIEFPLWQRWNDYGIGLLLEKSEYRQAEGAFKEVEKLNRFDGPLNLARVYFEEGRLDEAVEAITRASKHTSPPAPRWTMAWLSGIVNRQQGHLEDAANDFRSALSDKVPERKFDFSKDYEVINLLGMTLFDLARQELAGSDRRKELLEAAAAEFKKTLKLDPENVAAHHNLHLIYDQLENKELSAEHQKLHDRYRLDDNARDRAVALARKNYPAANAAAEALVIYPLQRPGAPGLDTIVAKHLKLRVVEEAIAGDNQ